ncbi:MAG: sucrase ferredoxin, partial [Jatrophihabitans endophyticus]
MTRSRPRPRESLDRCALRAQLRGDQMLGTAFPAARLLLVEQPGPWGQGGLRTSYFDPATALALEARGRAEGVRVQAIRRPGRSPRRPQRRWAVVDTRGTEPSLRWGSFTDDTELLELPL